MSSGILKGSPLGQSPRLDDVERRPARCASCRSAIATSASTSRRTPMSRQRCARRSRRSRPSRAAGVRASHRRPDAPLESGGVRHASAGAVRTVPPGLLRARRARRARGRRQELPGSDSARARSAPAGTASTMDGTHFIGLVNVVNLKAGGPRLAGGRPTRMAREGRQAAQEQHAHRRLCAHPALDGLSGVGMGDRGQRAGPVVLEAVRFGLGPERPHPSGDAEGRRERHVPHGHVDRLPATRARHGAVAGPDEGGRRSAAQGARALAHVVSRREPPDRDHRPAARRATVPRTATTSRSTTSASRPARRPCRSAQQSPGRIATTFHTTSSAPNRSSSHLCSIPTNGSRFASTGPAPTSISARFIPR